MSYLNNQQPAKPTMNMNNIRAIMIFFIVSLSLSVSSAQVIDKLQKSFSDYQENNFREKVYVHVNKTFYVTGEILWFKVYSVQGRANERNTISKVAYVDVLDNNHLAVMQAKIALKDGKGNGSLFIPVSIKNGNYQLRAYTNWMKNFGADCFFEKQITVVNPLRTPAVPVNAEIPSYDVQFFPEGGHLVAGLAGKVAFKITGADGRGVDGSGTITDEQGNIAARFKTLKFGIGSFVFTPAGHHVYKAAVSINNQVMIKELAVSESGYVLRSTAAGEGWNVKIQRAGIAATESLFLLVHSRNAVKIAREVIFMNDSAGFEIDKNKLDDGLNYVTLFDARQRPLCERLIFKRPSKKLIIDARVSNEAYNIRNKVSLAIATRSQDNRSVAANLSVAVYREDGLQNNEAGHINSYIWLGADLKGHIESPDYYLENTDAEADEALDNLILSQGWTQFDWNNTLSVKPTALKFLPEYTGHIITGRVTNTINREPAKGVVAYLSVPGSRQQLYIAKSDSTGRLLFNAHDLYGPGEIIVQTNTQYDSTYHVDILSPFSEQYSATPVASFTLTSALERVIAESSVNMQAENIFKGSLLKQFYLPQTDSIPFYDKPVKTYLLDNYTRFTTIEEVLREYVTSISVSKKQGKFTIKMYNVDKPLNGKPIVLLDGTPVFDADKIFYIDPLKVKRLDVVSTDYLYGPAVLNGVMSFITYKGDMNGFEIDPRAVILDYDGLQQERKFYSPVYDTDQLLKSTIPDFRTVLYWNADVNTTQGVNNLTFYTSDRPGRYIGVVEGNTASGEAGSGYFTFEVKK
ncbi:MAG: hypothetical protein JWR50_95 [Mucilaginibacter sp.]|nr:hypothetical protein [Mucilaginibacter sp.]